MFRSSHSGVLYLSYFEDSATEIEANFSGKAPEQMLIKSFIEAYRWRDNQLDEFQDHWITFFKEFFAIGFYSDLVLQV